MSKDGYMEFVEKKAMELGKIFFLDSGEGNDFFDENRQWYIEDLSGWLINVEDKDRFICCKHNNTVYDEFPDSYIFVKWSKLVNGEIEIVFKNY